MCKNSCSRNKFTLLYYSMILEANFVQADHNSLAEGVIWKKLLLFALPILLGNIFQQLYNTVDALIVGTFLDKTALAAVTSSGSLIFMMVGFFNGIAMGAGVVISKLFGAKDYDGMRLAAFY